MQQRGTLWLRDAECACIRIHNVLCVKWKPARSAFFQTAGEPRAGPKTEWCSRSRRCRRLAAEPSFPITCWLFPTLGKFPHHASNADIRRVRHVSWRHMLTTQCGVASCLFFAVGLTGARVNSTQANGTLKSPSAVWHFDIEDSFSLSQSCGWFGSRHQKVTCYSPSFTVRGSSVEVVIDALLNVYPDHRSPARSCPACRLL